MNAYIDTGLLVKAFVLESDSPETIRLLEMIGEPFAYSHLHGLEIPNAIRLKRFRGEISKAQETAALRAFQADVDAGRFAHLGVDPASVFIGAGRLSAKYSAGTGARSLYLWHIAAALEAGCDTFATNDSRQRDVAGRCGLTVLTVGGGREGIRRRRR